MQRNIILLINNVLENERKHPKARLDVFRLKKYRDSDAGSIHIEVDLFSAVEAAIDDD